ncbi:MAG: carboxypeptidase-like regulatory domain-containing protein, partial [Verrucomicrobia bacterium]|nr:carboxypeptidase-like regulatory domain-containing protein [Verrucomicrobiota bacterium]
MTTPPFVSRPARSSAVLLAVGLSLTFPAASAQTAGTATLTGRVQNTAGGAALENARVTLAGTNRETFTDAFGEYRFT